MNAESDDTQPRWQVGLLGGLLLTDGAQQFTRLPSRAVTALLARLALGAERVHPREELIELLWPGVAVAVGRNRLRQALSTLKSVLEPVGQRALRPVLLADRLGVRVVPGSLACDAVRFERHAREGRVDAALALYRGELLPGFYDDWIDEERLRLAALHDGLARQAPARAIESHLARDFARPVAPAPATARVALPSYLTRMFGADAQAGRLRALVLAQRLVTLIGPGGSGKSRLAVEVAHSLREHADWPLPASDPAQPLDLIAFVALAACTTREQACDALTGALRIAPGALDPLLALTDALGGRRALLVLDNFEQLDGSADDLVAQLGARLPLLHLMVTSRRPLGLDGEHEFMVAPLELPATDADLGAAARNPAVALFVERARAVRSDFHCTQRNAATLVALARALEGMPLAIELAAARVRSIAPADMLARLAGPGTPRLDLLARGQPRAAHDARHASMKRTIEWSWQLLAPAQARLLCALTVFADGFDAASAVALVGSRLPDVALRLDDLVAHSLVHSHAAADGDRADHSGSAGAGWRFGLYQPIREFAAAQLDDDAAREWRSRLRAWAVQWARALPTTPSLPALRTEMPNLLAALASAVESDAPDGASDDAVELLLALRRCLEDVELPAVGLADAQTAISRCTQPLLRARGHTALGPLLYIAGQADAGLRHAELGLACDLLDATQRARALQALARVRWRNRRSAAEVEPLLDEAQTLALVPTESGDDLELRAGLLALRGFVVNAHHQDPARAEELHAQALALWERAGNQHAIDSGRYNLAGCVQNTRRFAQSLLLLDPVIASAQALHDWRRLSQSLNVRGNAHSGLRAWPAACADFRECIRIAWHAMALFDLAYGLWNLPRALAHVREPAAAIRLVAFAAAFWRTRFGELSAADARYLVRVRRLAGRQTSAAHIEALWREGEQLPLAQAVAMALRPLRAAA